MRIKRELYVGIPSGSLNRDSRKEPHKGDTKLLLETAGWRLKGYEYKQEIPFPEVLRGDREVKFCAMKPRNFPSYLRNHGLDLAICGRDTMIEWY